MPEWSGETYAILGSLLTLIAIIIGVTAVIINVLIHRFNAQDKTIEAYESKVDSKFDVIQAQMTSVKEAVTAGAEEHKDFRHSVAQTNSRIDNILMRMTDKNSRKEG